MAGDVEKVDSADDRVSERDRQVCDRLAAKRADQFMIRENSTIASIVLATNILRSSTTVRDHKPRGKGLAAGDWIFVGVA
ncbi:MAG: hypothetical protein JO223_13175 [Hyphomicrobiales bacterium]|nr:hypothetical protein [Hyphomicrobiales bacterium]MBV8442831.1 hypothetical protein [Hyphomicrobiales bacterium]